MLRHRSQMRTPRSPRTPKSLTFELLSALRKGQICVTAPEKTGTLNYTSKHTAGIPGRGHAPMGGIPGLIPSSGVCAWHTGLPSGVNSKPVPKIPGDI